MAQLGARLDGIEEVVGSNPIGSTNFFMYSPERSFTERSEDIAYTLGPKGLCERVPLSPCIVWPRDSSGVVWSFRDLAFSSREVV